MKKFIVKKNKKLSTMLSIYFFIIIAFLGIVGGLFLSYLERKSRINHNKEHLVEYSSNNLSILLKQLNIKKLNSEKLNKIVTAVLNIDNLNINSDDKISGVFIPNFVTLNNQSLKRLNNTKFIWDLVGKEVLEEFLNFWIISKDNFIRITPKDQAFGYEENYNLLDSYYYKVGSPENNPEKIPRWTSVYYDSEIGGWLTSLVIPIYENDIFYGVTGSDLLLEDLFKSILFSNMGDEELGILVFNNDGDIIIHPEPKNPESNYSKDLNIFIQKTVSGVFKKSEIIRFKNKDKIVYGITYYMDFLDWNITYFFREATILKEIFRSQINMFSIFIFLAVFMVLISWFVLNKLIIKPVNILSVAASDFYFGKNVDLITKRNDEIGTLAKSFETMESTIKKQIRELKDENSERLESEKKFRRLIENLGKEYFFYSYSTFGNYTYISDSVNEMLEYSPEDFKRNYNMYLTDNEINNQMNIKVKEAIKGNKQESYNIELYSKNNRKVLLELVETPIFDSKGHVVSVEGIAHDITEIKKSELELKRHKDNLEDIIDDRSKELEQTLLELVETKKMAALGELVSGVAHEINTPVGIGVTGATHLNDLTKDFEELYITNNLSKSKFEIFIKEMKETSKIILSNMVKAASLIKGFKEIAVDQTMHDIRVFNLKEYIDEILLSIHSEVKHTSHKIIVECSDNIEINSYPGAISQILTNLIFNTIKHGFEGISSGEIIILAETVNSNVQIIYKDNGNGIDKEIIDKIYDPFFTTKRGQGGSGLGMNIVLNLVQKTLLGSIECKSEINEGTEFKIVFPREIEEVK